MTLISSIVPARQAARIPPIAAMRSVALERPINRVVRSAIGLVITGLGVLLLLGRRLPTLGTALPVVAAFTITVLTGAFLADAVGDDPLRVLAPPLVSFLPGLTRVVGIDSPDISGTEIRRRVMAGEPLGGMVSPAVATIIEERGLYR